MAELQQSLSNRRRDVVVYKQQLDTKQQVVLVQYEQQVRGTAWLADRCTAVVRQSRGATIARKFSVPKTLAWLPTVTGLQQSQELASI